MKLYRRHGAWYVDCSFNGKRVRKRVGPVKKDAIQVGKQIESDLIAGYYDVAGNREITFDELSAEYLKFSKANKQPQVFRRDKGIVKRLLRVFKRRKIANISAHDLETYKIERINEVAPATVNRELTCIKHILNKAVEWRYLRHNQLRLVQRLKEPPGRLRYLTNEEVDLLLRKCASHLRPIVITALNTGLRKGKILNLKWSDVDMTNRVITVKRPKNNETKTVPINETLYKTLKSLKPKKDGRPVFANENGEPYGDVRKSFATALKRAGIENFRFHDLRHTFASHLVMAGVDIRTVQELMGHKDIRMTMRYSHLSNAHLKEAVKRIEHDTEATLAGE